MCFIVAAQFNKKAAANDSLYFRILTIHSQKLNNLQTVFQCSESTVYESATDTSSQSRESLQQEAHRRYKRTFTKNPYITPLDRLEINSNALDKLKAKTEQAFKRSYLFQPGKQKQDTHFNNTFCGVYGAYRGRENLVDKVSYDLAKSFPRYSDISETIYYTEDALDTNVEVTKHLPTKAIISELQEILEIF